MTEKNNVIKAINKEPLMPHNIKKILNQREKLKILENDYKMIKSHIYKFV